MQYRLMGSASKRRNARIASPFDVEHPGDLPHRVKAGSCRICVFRSIVTARFGIVTAEFGIVTGHFGDVTDGVFAPA